MYFQINSYITYKRRIAVPDHRVSLRQFQTIRWFKESRPIAYPIPMWHIIQRCDFLVTMKSHKGDEKTDGHKGQSAAN